MVKPESFNRVVVDTAALEHNYRSMQRRAADAEVLAMVKSDGYGHGLETAAAAFARAGCRCFGVAELSEGISVREFGCDGEILVFLGFDPGDIDFFFSHRLTPVIFTRKDLERVAAVALERRRRLGVYLKFDCGMSRLGFKPREAELLAELVESLDQLELLGCMTHFPCSDDPTSDSTAQTYQLFRRACLPFGSPELIFSAGNSGGALYFPEAREQLVRCGIALYGYYPDGSTGRQRHGQGGLRPAMTVSTRVLQVQGVAAGSGVSYGHTFVAERDLKLAVLPLGYSDGYPRSLSNQGAVLIRGRRAPIRGRICMNLCMVEVSDIDGVIPGDEAVVLGSQGSERIDADDIAQWAGTISYEILCSLGSSNLRTAR